MAVELPNFEIVCPEYVAYVRKKGALCVPNTMAHISAVVFWLEKEGSEVVVVI